MKKLKEKLMCWLDTLEYYKMDKEINKISRRNTLFGKTQCHG